MKKHLNTNALSQPLITAPSIDAMLNWRSFEVPLAKDLKPGDKIKDTSGQAVLEILNESQNEALIEGVAGAKVIFCDRVNCTYRDTFALAYVKRQSQGLFLDSFLITVVLTDTSSTSVQPHDIYKVERGAFGRNVTLSKQHEGGLYQPLLKAKNAYVRLSLFCWYETFVFKFYTVHKRKRLVMVRNQKEKTVEFQSSISATEAVTLAWVIDLMTMRCHCKMEKDEIACTGVAACSSGALCAIVIGLGSLACTVL